jgi:hypothetical protein
MFSAFLQFQIPSSSSSPLAWHHILLNRIHAYGERRIIGSQKGGNTFFGLFVRFSLFALYSYLLSIIIVIGRHILLFLASPRFALSRTFLGCFFIVASETREGKERDGIWCSVRYPDSSLGFSPRRASGRRCINISTLLFYFWIFCTLVDEE